MADFDARGVIPASQGQSRLAGIEHRGRINGGTVQTVEVPITVLAPGLAIPVAEKRACLAALLPNGTDRYVGLFVGLPNFAGIGGTEASGSGYARVAVDSWSFDVLSQVVRRINAEQIVFPTLTGDLVIVGWGIWDAAMAGNLKAFGRTRSAGGAPIAFELGNGDTPRFLVNELKVGIQ